MPKGLQGLQNAVQPMTGPSSIEAALAALSPEEQSLVLSGVDPYGGDTGMMAGQPAVNPAMMNQTASTLSPEARMAISESLAGLMAAMGNPGNEREAAAIASIQNAMMALSGE